MRLNGIISSSLRVIIVVHVVYDYATMRKRISKGRERILGNDDYPSFKDSIVMVLLPMSTILIPFSFFEIYSMLIFENEQWMGYFFLSIIFAFILGPSLNFAFFGNYRAAGTGLVLRMMLLLVSIKLGW